MSNSAFSPQLVLPTTGLAAGTYGNAFTTLILTVNSSGQITATSAPAINQAGGFINKIRNATMDIWQRGTSITVTAGTSGNAGSYTADGWRLSSTGANVTASRGNNGNPTHYTLTIAGNTGVTNTNVRQRIESFLTDPLNSGICTVQFKIFNNTGASITPTVSINSANAQDDFSATTSIVSGASLQSCANSATTTCAYSFTNNSSSNGLEAIIDFGSSLNAGTKNVSVHSFDLRATPGVTTGLNNNPPPPELRAVGIELPLNQRYYVNTFNPGTAPATGVGVNTQSQLSILACTTTAVGNSVMWHFPVQMRATPSITTYNTVSANANWRDATASTDLTAALFGPFGPQRTLIYVSQAVGAIGNNLSINASASAEL